ncbi:hypothetical protein F5B22DRAFT_585723 [Xylaria bambusicola]|uniref:uncharacterized protein n=1 Tax=Xylaria bambusicola TaxID=326684 RepID=UPI002008457E|nr:uncharacterized protein F5B22DRAFT_585723 [Xylaria bambusicola]KAI0526433.1 hypothetical protein F5B22DRAFT_585723 [Xylaria bambusicola]
MGTSSSPSMSSVFYPNTTALQSSTIQSSSTTVAMTTSTVYSTNIYTITSCAPTITDCPAKVGQVTTELVSLYTTVCPVEQGEATSAQGSPTSPILLTTSTVYTTSVYTVSSCESGAIDCSSNIGSVTTELVPAYTTVCPVKDEETASSLPANTEQTQTRTVSITSLVIGDSSTLARTSPSSLGCPAICETCSGDHCPDCCKTSSRFTSSTDVPSYTMSEIESTVEMSFSRSVITSALS